jgi:hypothetical protein
VLGRSWPFFTKPNSRASVTLEGFHCDILTAATAQRARRADELEKTNESKGVDLNERARDGKTEPAAAFLI